MKKSLPIGNDQFTQVREKNAYYVDKTMLIQDFIQADDTVALITRPRRFGKTLNMTMLREFFDITKDSSKLFLGLAIMDTEYASQMNTRPVVYFSFKDCTGENPAEMKQRLMDELFRQYARYYDLFEQAGGLQGNIYCTRFYQMMEKLRRGEADYIDMAGAIEYLLTAVKVMYQKPVVLLIDEYDQPILSSYENGYYDELKEFFVTFYGMALKGNENLDQALLTGIQRVAKESIFSKLNNITVYTVQDSYYAQYFGLEEKETEKLLAYYDLPLTEDVKRMYDGYEFGGYEIYNPWSVLTYAKKKDLIPYWINTSTNYLVHEAMKEADQNFLKRFEELIQKGQAEVGINLETSFIELKRSDVLWGLLVNSGYLKIVGKPGNGIATVKIPNYEVKQEFQRLVADYIRIPSDSLSRMFEYLTHGKMDAFMEVYSQIVLTTTSYYDAKENAYHMLFLGMCVSMDGIYKVTSNLEAGIGRSDITLEARNRNASVEYCPNIIIEFKQGENIAQLKLDALQQIKDKKYAAGQKGKVLAIGLAHNIKACEMVYEYL